MARYNEILAGRFNRYLEKLLSMKGPPPAPQLASDIQPTISILTGTEENYLLTVNRYGLSFSLAPVAAAFGQIRLRNPKGSNVIVVVEKLFWFNFTGADQPAMSTGPAATDLATIANVVTARFDNRGNPQPASIVSGTAAALSVLPSNKMQGGITAANTGFEFLIDRNQEVPILPGDGIQVSGNQANQSVQLSIWWRERALEESELI